MSIYDLDSEPSARVSLSCKTKLLNNVRDALVEQSSPITPGKSYTFGRRVRVEYVPLYLSTVCVDLCLCLGI